MNSIWGDLYGQSVLYDVNFLSNNIQHDLRVQSCTEDAMQICKKIYLNADEIQTCQRGMLHGELIDYSNFSDTYILGNLIENFKCGGLRENNKCINRNQVNNTCQDISCRSKLKNNMRYDQIRLSEQEMNSSNAVELLRGELFSRLMC